MSAHHDEQQDIENAKYLWNKGGKWLFAALVAAAVVYFGHTVYQNHAQDKREAAAALAAQIQEGKGGDLAALQQQYPDSMGAAQATLHAAAQAFAQGKYDDAAQSYRWLLDNQKTPLIQAAAAQNLTNVYLQQKKYDEALKAAATPVDAAFQALLEESKGDIYAAQNKNNEAKQAYQSALDKLPKTENANAARETLEWKLAQF